MNLRNFVIGLLVANLLLAGWFRGWFDAIVGFERRTEREPQRLLQQIKPETIKVVPSNEADKRAPPTPPSPTRSSRSRTQGFA